VNSVARNEDIGRDFREKYCHTLRYIVSIENHNVAKRVFETAFDILQVFKSRT